MRTLRKSLAVAGLMILGLLGYQLMVGQISLVDAAQRATAVMFALMLLQWAIRLTVTTYMKRLDSIVRSAEANRATEAVDLRRDDAGV